MFYLCRSTLSSQASRYIGFGSSGCKTEMKDDFFESTISSLTSVYDFMIVCIIYDAFHSINTFDTLYYLN